MNKVWKQFTETSDLDPEVYIVISKNRATLKELDNDYSVDDLMTLMEIIDVEASLDSAAHFDADKESKKGNHK